jgi:molybdate transport system substrate-binding protein
MMRAAVCFVLTVLFAINAHAEEIRVAAASDLNFAIKEIIAGFEHKTGHTVRLTLGSSGNLSAQIIQGAPFQVFLSAGMDYAQQLEKAGRTEPGSTFVYGKGRIAVWVRRNSPVDVQSLGMQSVLDNAVKKISIANPEHAPYGRAAVEAMEKANIYGQAKAKLVMGESVSQAAQFVESGAADLGIIALSLAASDAMKESGRYWIVPESLHHPLEQAAVLVKGSSAAAKSFHAWLRSPDAVTTLKTYGFQ